ncbi:hypothetical protein ACFSEO_10450 [Agromyces cerinus subsp. nitratus]|uniref:hypothetical protein n=1 Tax=Agromyces cerinus TaxID=33878 RepID=UPI00363E5166
MAPAQTTPENGRRSATGRPFGVEIRPRRDDGVAFRAADAATSAARIRRGPDAPWGIRASDRSVAP